MSYNSKTEDDLVRLTNKDFDTNFGEIKSALFDYLKWFEIGPDLTEDRLSGLPKMKWDRSKDDLEAMKFIVRLAMLLSHLRCNRSETENTQGSQQEYVKCGDPDCQNSHGPYSMLIGNKIRN